MTRLTADSGPSGVSRRREGFTLIELLTVIAIILILAGLVLGLAGSAQYKAAVSRANAEIQALSSAANSYQIDNGTFPRLTTSKVYNGTITDPSDALDARTVTPATKIDPTTANYKESALVLYQLLCGSFYLVTSGTTTTVTYYDPSATNTGITKPTIYYPFKASQLKSGVTSGYVDPRTVTALNDPFGFSYGYSTAYQADIDAGTNPPTHGYNPTFDLWSTAGYAPAGKTYPTDIASAGTQSTLWVKNW